MRIRAEFDRRAAVHPVPGGSVPSPAGGSSCLSAVATGQSAPDDESLVTRHVFANLRPRAPARPGIATALRHRHRPQAASVWPQAGHRRAIRLPPGVAVAAV